MKKILFDLEATQPHLSGKRHGGGRYGEEVFKRILERCLPVAVYFDSSRWFNPEMLKLINENNVPLFDAKSNNLNEIISQHKFDLFYTPIIDDCKLAVKACPVKATIHGVRALELQYDAMMWRYRTISLKEKVKFFIKKFFPKYGYKHAYQMYLKPQQNENISFVMVSNHSANSFRSYYPNYDKEIKVFYSPSTSLTEDLDRKYNQKYFLLVSGNRWEKNDLRPIIALDRLFSSKKLNDFKVKITGVKGADAYNYKFQNPDKFDFCGYVEDGELEQLYHDAYALIYMSFNEGFGYPPLEAMHYGVPCILSPFTSIPEVCGNAALYANPYSVEEIMSRIIMLVDCNLYSGLSKASVSRFVDITKKQKKDLDNLINYIYE